MILPEPLETSRLILRHLHQGDTGHPYLGWMHNAEVVRYLEIRHAPPQTEASLAAYITAANDAPDVLMFGICLQIDGRHIGNIKLGPIDRHHRRSDLGFLIGDRDCWGKGYASEAIKAVATFALRDLGLHKVTSGCYAPNVGSARALTKAGFSSEGVMRSHWLSDGEFVDGHLFALISPEFVS